MEGKKRVIALGFFDGVHLGHGALLKRVGTAASAGGLIPAAVTFDHHPRDVIPGAQKVSLLNTGPERQRLMQELYGIRDVIVLPFDAHMRDMSWRSFVTDLLVGEYGAAHLVAGHSFRFGRGGEGTPEKLAGLCGELGLACDIIDRVEVDGETVSSTRIRELIRTGEMERAVRALGHPHVLSGQVIRGKHLGRTIGIPTSNIPVPAGVLVPAFGVYASRVWVGDACHLAVTNIGVRPTVEDSDRVSVEPWLLDFSGDLYDRVIRVELYKRLRAERKFASLEELRAEILRNAQQTREFFP